MSLALRAPTLEEASQLSELRATPDVRRWLGPPSPTASMLAAVQAGAEVVGFVHVDTLMLGDEQVGAYDLAVAETHRRRGYGTEMALAAERYLRTAKGIEAIVLGVHEANTAARRLYESLGYREAAKIVAPDGAPALLLRKDLRGGADSDYLDPEI